MASVLNTGIDGIIQQKDAQRKEFAHEVRDFQDKMNDKERNLKNAPLPIRVLLWPVTITIKVVMETARWMFLIPHMIWHRLVDDSAGTADDLNPDALVQSGAPLFPGASFVPRKFVFRVLDRVLQGKGMLVFQTHVQPYVSWCMAAPINVLIPWVLDRQILTFVVPYAAWKALVGFFGNEGQMLETAGYNADMAKIGERVARQKAELEDERDELVQKVNVLQRQLSDIQFQRQNTDFSHVNGSTEL